MRIECFLVIAKRKGMPARAVKITQGRPALRAHEAMIKLVLDAPDELFEAPLITFPVAMRQVAVAVDAEEF